MITVKWGESPQELGKYPYVFALANFLCYNC